MRKEFLTGLTELAHADERIILLTADLGFGSIEVFADAHPRRFINVGVSEQAMIGYATGLAEAGFIPYCYSIASFAVARTFEFLRNGPIGHSLPVRLVGIGPGVDYGTDGHTHHALEDVALVLSQPNSTVVAPRDGESAHRAGVTGSELRGLVYYRLARVGTPVDTAKYEDMADPDVMVFAFGDTIPTALHICESLDRSVELVSLQEVNRQAIEAAAHDVAGRRPRKVVLLEHHFMASGVGTLLGDALLRAGWAGKYLKWGFDDSVIARFGDQSALTEQCTPSVAGIIKALQQ